MKKYPAFLQLCQDFVAIHAPGFEFNSVYVNQNVVCQRHTDSKNIGQLLLVGLGDYEGGETTLHNCSEEGDVSFNIKDISLRFNGAEIEHSSKSFTGTRYSLVFFK